MKIDVFDVGHGACSMVTAPNGQRIMIDCGSLRTESYWWPSIHFYNQVIDGLILTNLDEDHVADFDYVIKNISIKTVHINETINPYRLLLMKTEGMQTGVTAVHNYLHQSTTVNLPINIPGLTISSFRFPYGTFTDTNNLSLITFIQYGLFCILYPGDLEIKGWKRALDGSCPQFLTLLSKVNLFVTSHHGRENGCCEEIFSFCKPDAFIISDKEMVHETQETTDWYRQHARGLVKLGTPLWEIPERRYVFTTRKDGCMSIDVDPFGGFVLRTNSDRQEPKYPARKATATAG